MCVRGLDFSSFYHFSIGLWNGSDRVGGPWWLNELGIGLPNNSYKPFTNTAWVHTRLCKLQKRCTRLATASDKAYQLLAHGRWFSPGSPASSTTKTGRHDIAEILLKSGAKHQKPNQQNHRVVYFVFHFISAKHFKRLMAFVGDQNK